MTSVIWREIWPLDIGGGTLSVLTVPYVLSLNYWKPSWHLECLILFPGWLSASAAEQGKLLDTWNMNSLALHGNTPFSELKMTFKNSFTTIPLFTDDTGNTRRTESTYWRSPCFWGRRGMVAGNRGCRGEGTLGRRGQTCRAVFTMCPGQCGPQPGCLCWGSAEDCKVAGCPPPVSTLLSYQDPWTAQDAELGVTHMSLQPKCLLTEEWTRRCGTCAQWNTTQSRTIMNECHSLWRGWI